MKKINCPVVGTVEPAPLASIVMLYESGVFTTNVTIPANIGAVVATPAFTVAAYTVSPC